MKTSKRTKRSQTTRSVARGCVQRMVSMRASLVQQIRELIMDIPSGISAAAESDTWVMWKDWDEYCTRATKILNEIDKQANAPAHDNPKL